MYQPAYITLDPLSMVKRKFKRHLNIIGIILIISILRYLLHFIIRVYQIIKTKSFLQPTSLEFWEINTVYFYVFYAVYFAEAALFILFYFLASDFRKLEEALPKLEFKPNKITITLIIGATYEFITMLFSILRIFLVHNILLCFTPLPFIIAFWFMRNLFLELENKKIIDKRADRILLYSQIYILFFNIIHVSIQNTKLSNWTFNAPQFSYYVIFYVGLVVYYVSFILGIYRTSNDFTQIKGEKQEILYQQISSKQEVLIKDSNIKFCIECGSKNKHSAKFCSSCGSEME